MNLLLRRIVAVPELHAGLLNTFSYLEYVGFAKIVKSQEVEKMDITTLQHTAEELRHAQLLKKLSIKVGGARYADYAPENLLCGVAARSYFEQVDHGCDHLLDSEPERARLCYLYVTWLVEVRAISVYGSYLQVLREHSVASALESLLKEEDRHLDEVTSLLAAEDPMHLSRQREMTALEERAFAEFTRELEMTLELRQSLAAHVF